MPKDKPPTGSLYPRESFVCFFVFLVELAAVWSLVALIYLLFANYFVYSDEKNAGILQDDPAMCTTTRNILSTNCTWWSCMEWCLSATSKPGSCIHLYATVRNRGSSIKLENCSPGNENETIKECPFQDLQDPYADFIYDCKEDFICQQLTGTFKCEDPYQPGVPMYQLKKGGFCKNITEMYECSVANYSETINNCKEKRYCLDLSGVYTCRDGQCQEMVDFHCERRCKDIACDKNVIIMSGDNILLGDCDQVVDLEDEEHILWENDGINTLLANCLTVELDPNEPDNMTYIATDCINGTLYPKGKMPKTVNYTHLLQLFADPDAYTLYKLAEGNNTDIPFDIDITLFEEKQLKFNHEGCSNLLNEECTRFHKVFGQDGHNYTSKSRFPCFYSADQTKMDYVISRLDLAATEYLFIILLIVPMTIFICSCFWCFVCSSIIIVDDEGHMHLKCCYSFFRAPYTEYEKWNIQHEQNKTKRLKQQEKIHQEELRMLERVSSRRDRLTKSDSIDTFTDINIMPPEETNGSMP